MVAPKGMKHFKVQVLYPFLLVTLCFSSFMQIIHGSNLIFSYYPNITAYHDADFLYSENSDLAGGALLVTMDSRNSLLTNQAGRVVHRSTLRLWGRDKRSDVASFNTAFVINILPVTNPGGEGMAFILTPDRFAPSNSYGSWLGIMNQETNGSPSNKVVAIEFDTRKSDPGDVDSNHIAVDVCSMDSVYQFPLDRSIVNLSSGKDVFVKIMYDGELRNMSVELSMGNGSYINQPTFSFSFPLNLTDYLPQDVYVGFSASTSTFTELNSVRSWNFTSTSVGKKLAIGQLLIWLAVIIVGLLVFFVIAVVMCKYKFSCKIRGTVEKKTSSIEGSKTFKVKELASATSNFDKTKILGQGGCGVVYKGVLKGVEVAVKRFNDPSRGEKEFFSEVKTIGLLDHPSLVKLIGCCKERRELLLVYQYMSNGSLNQILFSRNDGENSPSSILSWPQRLQILVDVASALVHLHDGSKHPLVFHKDIKASNIMLDDEMNAYLGDFGIARTVEKPGSSHHTTQVIAGTVCYIAPEYCNTGQASMKTDVYSFGALAAEVCCGEKPIENRAAPWYNNVVDQLWQHYREGNILGAADPRLRGEFDREMMKIVMKLALLCFQHEASHRPSSSLLLKVLKGEESLPESVELQPPPSALLEYTPSQQTPRNSTVMDEDDIMRTSLITDIVGR